MRNTSRSEHFTQVYCCIAMIEEAFFAEDKVNDELSMSIQALRLGVDGDKL